MQLPWRPTLCVLYLLPGCFVSWLLLTVPMQIVIERGATLLPGSDWHLQTIEVVDVTRGHTYK